MPTRLKEERLRQGLTLFELAKRTGIHVCDISKVENAKCWPYPAWRRRLSEALGVPEEELFGEVTSGEAQRGD